MLGDIFFVLRMFVITIAIVLVMQVHIGEKSIEDHFHNWVKHSAFIDYVEEAVDGGAAIVRSIYKKTDTSIHGLLAKTIRKHEKKERGLGITLKRHIPKEDDLDEVVPAAKAMGTSGATKVR